MTYFTLYSLLNNVPLDDKFLNTTSNVLSLIQYTIPDGKLFYPEPFIASPSYLHSDLTYLHIFQYWYWLWFLFVFMICFFFISFVCVTRWCATRIRPRRETRGVSRSKCGDLITACVPVSWAISIIVNESTDATDLNDGFGTAELIVGVRAYQWGWEYYYPKTLDLNYNVHPSYSSFIGNSLKYTYSSGKSLSTVHLWQMYQNKFEDQVITPAHLLLLPLDNNSSLNFINFRDVGLNTLKESSAFSKIRNYTKVYNTHLVHTPSELTTKYLFINKTFMNENSFLSTSSFGLKRQHNLISNSTFSSLPSSTLLDSKSFDQFLNSNLALNTKPLSENILDPLPSTSLTFNKGIASDVDTSKNLNSLRELTFENTITPPLTKLTSYPTTLKNINDNSDKAGLSHVATKLSSSKSPRSSFLGSESRFDKSIEPANTSLTRSYINLDRLNQSKTNKQFKLSDSDAKVLLTEQSVRLYPELIPSKSNLNLSNDVNPILVSNNTNKRLNLTSTPSRLSTDSLTGYTDHQLVNNISSSRSLMVDQHPAVLSSRTSMVNSLNYDTNKIDNIHVIPRTQEVKNFVPVSDMFIGSREKTPRVLNSTYWDSFWASSNASTRVSTLLTSNLRQSKFYLPVFSSYVDYDFRNDQAIDMLEELFWETSFSGYNFYEYMTIAQNFSKNRDVYPKDLLMDKQFYPTVGGEDNLINVFSNKALTERDLIGDYYSNSIQLEDSNLDPSLVITNNFFLFPIYSEIQEMDDVFNSFKGLSTVLTKFSSTMLSVDGPILTPRSYLSVFNNFRDDYEDFNWYKCASNDVSSSNTSTDFTDWTEGSVFGLDIRLSNVATLRPSIRNSIINYNAFKKVFRARFDEQRSHSQSVMFADLGLKQPILSDFKIPYTQLLGKNRDSFFESPLYLTSVHKNTNFSSALAESLNAPMYDFPFLLAKTSDIIRFTWLDWFSRWGYVEVQPSSVSRYSTLGVPYVRKPFDFNSATGDKYQDTTLYFTRVSRSRRNYLPNWSYSPYLYNKAYVWNSSSNFSNTLLRITTSLSSAIDSCNYTGWYWNPTLNNESMLVKSPNYSSSGNNIYNKSTWRPRSSIQSFYANMSSFIDILSKREFLYRQLFEQSSQVISLPATLSASPANPLLKDLKSSFLFTDPANFSSEYSKDLLYTSDSYFDFILFKNLIDRLYSSVSCTPINHAVLTNYVFYYFFSCDNFKFNENPTLYKSQFRPLKKGISNMLRLHATGAVAMPVEIRLQVLASSRDVIHSWAIPSANIKIDCIPGYTSHRTMKFLLTGVYWGQCQEICGRYHHWMPIVLYFMKRDLFFLWCTHFIFKPTPSRVLDSSDRRFNDLVKLATYDRSTWLSEFGLTS